MSTSSLWRYGRLAGTCQNNLMDADSACVSLHTTPRHCLCLTFAPDRPGLRSENRTQVTWGLTKCCASYCQYLTNAYNMPGINMYRTLAAQASHSSPNRLCNAPSSAFIRKRRVGTDAAIMNTKIPAATLPERYCNKPDSRTHDPFVACSRKMEATVMMLPV